MSVCLEPRTLKYNKPRKKAKENVCHLFNYQHFVGFREFACTQSVEVEATRNRFSPVILTVPIRRTAFVPIEASQLISQCQRPNQSTISGIDGQHYFRRFCEVIRYPRLGIEWVWIVRQHSSRFWHSASLD